ncbi:MAG: FAD-linked oxidase C-terminal domain-containing protein [Nitrospirota bacterium]
MLKPQIIHALQSIAGRAFVTTDTEDLVAYSYDATQQKSLPEVVVQPETTEQISEIMKLANRELIPVVPRGAGTGMSGGSVPVHGGIVLSLASMDRILEINEKDMLAVVEPGVITGNFQREVEAKGLFYPPDPASHDTSTIGGNVAECAGGLRAVKYGVTKDYILGLEVVLPTGEIIRTGARTIKSVAGYDLTRLFTGSEGTLGIITKITLKLLPLPESIKTLSAFFPAVHSAATTVLQIIANRITPRAMELIDRTSLQAVGQYLQQDPAEGAAALLLVEVDGDAISVKREADTISAIMHTAGGFNIRFAESGEEREQLWKTRRSISPALYLLKPKKVNEDIVVPRSKIPDILKEITEISERYGLLIANFGHAGDGNIHTNIMIEEHETAKAESAVREIFAATLRLGGSISGEHGIGTAKAAYLPMELDADTLGAMKRIKQALDPNGILNPGKIFLDQ